jgi:protoporphyrinogen oxidase
MNMADLNERICIIGGGPAGLSAAMYLEKKGYKNYVIYEKDNRVGGKCYSPKVKMGPDDKEERTVEMGAIMGAKTYYAVHEAEEFGGVSHEDGPAMSRIYRDSARQSKSIPSKS